MRALGIIRRIDDLGRVVIPREVRRALRIVEGDPLEIFIDSKGIRLEKYSPIREMMEIAKIQVQAIYATTGFSVLICDKDSVVAVAGLPKKDYLNKKVSDNLVDIMMGKSYKSFVQSPTECFESANGLNIISDFTVAPIVAEGDAVGAVIVVHWAQDGNHDREAIVAELTASTIGKYLEGGN